MKRTSSMVYTPSAESMELCEYTINNWAVCQSHIGPTLKLLRKKYVQGQYNKEKAIDLYYTAASEAAKMYTQQYGYKFNVTQRFTAAVLMEQNYYEEISE